MKVFALILFPFITLRSYSYDKIFVKNPELFPEQNEQLMKTANFLAKKKACLLAYDYKAKDKSTYNMDKAYGYYNYVYCIGDRVAYPGTSDEFTGCAFGSYNHAKDDYDITFISKRECLNGGLEDFKNKKYESAKSMAKFSSLEKNMFTWYLPDRHSVFLLYSENTTMTNFFNEVYGVVKKQAEASKIEEQHKKEVKAKDEDEKKKVEKQNHDKANEKKKKLESIYE